ncbi:MAG TPA: hypothetical protein VHW70_06385 [Edaphobacter sp.]|nr:hypothetical protein [Edaphobacter sp.]
MSPDPTQAADQAVGPASDPSSDPCSTTTDPTAPAGSRDSLGAKSDCGGRPSSDDSVVEAMDEMGPGVGTPGDAQGARR